jgi:hypothetical protein
VLLELRDDAKTLGTTMPQLLLAGADELFE